MGQASKTRYINMFRGKATSDGTWRYGDLTKGNCVSNAMGAAIVYPETVGMYSGIIDRNGTRIFEGDILRFVNEDGDASCYKVVFDGQRFVTLQGQHRPEPFDDWWSKNGEVVGNIFEDPQLLAESE